MNFTSSQEILDNCHRKDKMTFDYKFSQCQREGELSEEFVESEIENFREWQDGLRERYYIYSDEVPESSLEYLTPGKRYEVIEPSTPNVNEAVIIHDDNGDRRVCLIKECAHLEYGNWKVGMY